MGRAFVEVVSLSRGVSKDQVAEGIIEEVFLSYDVTTTGVALAGTGRPELGQDGNAVIVTALTSHVLAQVMDSTAAFDAAKAKLIPAGGEAALKMGQGQVISLKEIA